MRRARQPMISIPRAPLAFSYLLSISGPEPEGLSALRELPEHYGPQVCRVIRNVLGFCRGPDVSAAIFNSGVLAEWESQLLEHRAEFDEAVWNPLFLIASELKEPHNLDLPSVAWSCMLIAEWALGQGAPGTAAELMEVAGVLWPENPRYAWMIGRFLRAHGYARQAYLWLTRAVRVGFRSGDWDVEAMALNSLGNLCIEQGGIEKGRRYLNRALTRARKHRLREREAKVLHDLFVLAVVSRESEAAEEYGMRAFECYGRSHPDLAKLAHDIAHLWCEQGHFSRALPVFAALLPFFHEPDARLRVLASAARAAGGAGDDILFQRFWIEAQILLEHEAVGPIMAESLLEIALGATSIGRWADARAALAQALDAACAWGQSETAARVEHVVEHVAREEAADHPARRPSARPADKLAHGLVKGLEAQLVAVGLGDGIRHGPVPR
jgi:tetratricopeptide (TPR) repeat protein